MHGCLYLVSVMLSGTGLCDGPMTGSEEFYQDVVCLSAIEEPRIGDLGPIELQIHEKKVSRLYITEIRF